MPEKSTATIIGVKKKQIANESTSKIKKKWDWVHVHRNYASQKSTFVLSVLDMKLYFMSKKQKEFTKI